MRCLAIAGISAFLGIIMSPAVLASTRDVDTQSLNIIAIFIFMLFVTSTLGITYWAAKRTKSREAFYAASRGISPWQNAFAIAGDFMSAATLLGITGLLFFVGYDAYILSFAIIIGWAIMLIVIAERFRNLGKFTFVDVVTSRLQGNSIRIFLCVCSLLVIMFYLIGQMVGAGKLIQLLFGIEYVFAVVIVSALMSVYVTFGGMLATTWVQMIKAILLMAGGGAIAFALLSKFGFSFNTMLEESIRVHGRGSDILKPGGWLKQDLFNVTSVGLTMSLGIMGLPHILMRFFTVKDASAARKSVAYATLIMSLFYIFILIIGLGSIAVLWQNPEFYDSAGNLRGGSNMVALHVASIMGGDWLFGFMAAVAFATILAVVAGLTLAGSATVAHDLYAIIMKKGKPNPKTELKISRIAVLIISALSALLGLVFEAQNIAVIVPFALALAASVNFPMLLLSIYWKGFTSRGALIGGCITSLFTLILMTLSESVWVVVLGNDVPIYPYVYPTVFSLPLGFVSMWVFSLMDKSATADIEKKLYRKQLIRSATGIGATGATDH